MAEALFYALSVLAVLAAVGVIASPNPLFCVLSLLGTLACVAVIYLLAGFQFLAVVQLLVYAGAILVLFLFVVMLLNLTERARAEDAAAWFLGRRRVAVASASAAAVALVVLVGAGLAPVLAGPELAGDTPPAVVYPTHGLDPLEPLAAVLFSRYVLPFEAASLLLLATMIAVILLAKRQRLGPNGEERWGWPFERERGR